MRNDDQKTSLILTVCGILPVVWLALLTAPYVSGGLVEIIRGLPVAMGNPFEITMCEDSVKTVLSLLGNIGFAADKIIICKVDKVGIEPVSYTHLTLPTN